MREEQVAALTFMVSKRLPVFMRGYNTQNFTLEECKLFMCRQRPMSAILPSSTRVNTAGCRIKGQLFKLDTSFGANTLRHFDRESGVCVTATFNIDIVRMYAEVSQYFPDDVTHTILSRLSGESRCENRYLLRKRRKRVPQAAQKRVCV
jgi:hypothetical protein